MRRRSMAIIGILLLVGLCVYAYSLRVNCEDGYCQGDCFCENEGFESLWLCAFFCYGGGIREFCPREGFTCNPHKV